MAATQASFRLANDLDVDRHLFASREHLSHFWFCSVGNDHFPELTQ
jgi:hypothetical protein